MRITIRIVAVLVTLVLLSATTHATFSATRVTVTTAATLIYTSVGNGASVCVFNRAASASVYLGGSTVATTTGAELPAGAGWCAVLGNGDRVYGIVAASTEVVHVTKVE